MKKLGIFYLIIVVLLSALPCSDELDAGMLNVDSSTVSAVAAEDCATESCSPICVCNCCGQSLIAINLFALQIETTSLDRPQLTSTYQFGLAQRNQNIWQPPKIA